MGVAVQRFSRQARWHVTALAASLVVSAHLGTTKRMSKFPGRHLSTFERIFNRQALTRSTFQDEVHVRLSTKAIVQSPLPTNYILENTHRTHDRNPPARIAHELEIWQNMG
jgi:hypothetical protein